MSLASLKKHLTALKLELLSDADALDASGPIVQGHVQTPPRTSSKAAVHSRAQILRSPIGSPAALLGSPSAPGVNAEIEELQQQLREAREANDKLESENRMMHDALVAAKQTEVADSAEVAELKQQLQQAASNATILSQYHDKLFNTLGAEFVLAIKHIAALENVIISAGDTPPARPDFVHHDTDAPSLPPHMQHMVNEHAATIVAHAAERLERHRQSGDCEEEDSDEDHGDEAILLQLEQQQHEMNAAVFQHQQQQFMQRQMMQQHMMAQHIMQQQQQQQQFGGVEGDDAEDDEDDDEDEAELASEDELEETSQTDF